MEEIKQMTEVLYYNQLEQLKIDGAISKITENIYIGNEEASECKEYLNEFGITHM